MRRKATEWKERGKKRKGAGMRKHECRQCDGSSDHVKLVSIDLARA